VCEIHTMKHAWFIDLVGALHEIEV
jgi:hypothetical protein